MDKNNIDHLFICKLLNICSNRALMEDALETRETILCAVELIRYIFDSSKTVVPLNKEIEAANIYINAFLTSENDQSGFELINSVNGAVYIDHMALLSFIIGDLNNAVSIQGTKDISYEVLIREDLYILKRIKEDIVLEFRISTR